MRKMILASLMVLIVLVMSGCDQVRNPFEGIDSEITTTDTGGFFNQPAGLADVEFSLPAEFQNIIFPGESKVDRVLSLAPASTNPKIWVESNLLDGALYPGETKKLAFTSTGEFAAAKTRMYTGCIGWLHAWFENGGTIYKLNLNGTRLTNIDANGAFTFQIATNGVVEQKGAVSGTKLVDVAIRLTANESTNRVIYFASDMTGGASLPMTYNSSSRVWELNLCYPASKNFWFICWSDIRILYGIGSEVLSINGTRAYHLESTGVKIDNTYTEYQFEGSLGDNGQFRQKDNNLSISI